MVWAVPGWHSPSGPQNVLSLGQSAFVLHLWHPGRPEDGTWGIQHTARGWAEPGTLNRRDREELHACPEQVFPVGRELFTGVLGRKYRVLAAKASFSEPISRILTRWRSTLERQYVTRSLSHAGQRSASHIECLTNRKSYLLARGSVFAGVVCSLAYHGAGSFVEYGHRGHPMRGSGEVVNSISHLPVHSRTLSRLMKDAWQI